MDNYNLLIIDDDEVIRKNLVNYLTRFHKAEYKLTLKSAETCKEAFELFKDNKFDLAIVDINMPDDSGFNLVEKIHKHYPETKTAMITAYRVEDYLKLARDKGVSNIIVKTAPFNFDELSKVVNGLLLPDKYIFGLHNYLKPGTLLKAETVDSSESITRAQYLLHECMANLNVTNIELLSIAILEAITNALYHGPRDPKGGKKYDRGINIQQVEVGDTVNITYGWDDEKLGIAIQDNGGSLSKEEVLYWLNRNATGTNVLDTSGRGFYLMHCIVDRVIINIKPKKLTELIFLIYLKDSYSGHKPVYINEV